MRRTLPAAFAILVLGAVALLVARDRQQQKRLEELSGRVAELSAAARQLAVPLQMLPSLVGQQRCVLDPKDLERLAKALPGKANGPAVAASTATADSAGKPARAALSLDQTAALDRARRRLDDVLARHTLSRADILEMRAQLATVGSPQAAEELRARLATAINHREVVPDERPFMLP